MPLYPILDLLGTHQQRRHNSWKFQTKDTLFFLLGRNRPETSLVPYLLLNKTVKGLLKYIWTVLMKVTDGSTFEYVRNCLADVALSSVGDGVIDNCDVSCLCVYGTVIYDARSKCD